MSPAVVDAIQRWIAARSSRRLAIITVHDVTVSPVLEDECRRRLGFTTLNVGLELGKFLLSVKPSRRLNEAEQWLLRTCRGAVHEPLLLTNIDLLFHPALEPGSSSRIDPLTLFQQVSRVVPLAVLWPGGYEAGVLSYAVPGHGHHRYWRPGSQIEVIVAD